MRGDFTNEDWDKAELPNQATSVCFRQILAPIALCSNQFNKYLWHTNKSLVIELM